MADPTNWIVPKGSDLKKVLDQIVVKAADANTGDDAQVNQPLDPDAAKRSDDAIDLVVQRFLGCIKNAARQPVSLTAGAVPPEAKVHVLVLSAFLLTASKPNLMMIVTPDGAIYAPFNQLVKTAEAWFKGVNDGDITVTFPSDPTGQDYLTEVTATNPLPSAVGFGLPDDMTDGNGDLIDLNSV